jgi:predicted nuclease of predicted toxin-antitoxin system
MKLLLDQNLSRRLCQRLSDIYPQIQHICAKGLATATDQRIWDYARKDGFVLVSKDGDFHELSFTYGAPPKVIWLKIGNCSTSQVEDVLRLNHETINQFIEDDEAALLLLEL